MNLDARTIESCLRVAAKKEAIRLKSKLIEIAKSDGVSLTKADFDLLEKLIEERLHLALGAIHYGG